MEYILLKSTAENVVDYKSVDLSQFARKIEIDGELAQEKLRAVQKRFSKWVEAYTYLAGVVIDGTIFHYDEEDEKTAYALDLQNAGPEFADTYAKTYINTSWHK